MTSSARQLCSLFSALLLTVAAVGVKTLFVTVFHGGMAEDGSQSLTLAMFVMWTKHRMFDLWHKGSESAVKRPKQKIIGGLRHTVLNCWAVNGL